MKMYKQLVAVTWRDASHYGRGTWLSNLDDVKPVIAVTVGYLVRKTRSEIVVAQTWSEDLGQFGGVWVVPGAWVTKVRRFK